MSDTAWIVGSGAITAVGGSVAQTVASVRAGISRYAESAVLNKRFRPMTLALAPEAALPPLADELATRGLTARQRRMLRLATVALGEAFAGLPDEPRIPLFVAGPETWPEPERPAAMTPDFVRWLAMQTGAPLDVGASRVFPDGRAGGLRALGAALALLAAGTHSRVAVGGVDTHLDLRLLAKLDQDDRVLADGVMDGFAPGEAAAFVVLGSSPTGRRVRIARPGLADEEGHRYSDAPYKGDGLATAIRLALEAAGGPTIGTALVSLNGESFGGKEWGVATMRNSAALSSSRVEHPADRFGDVGAACAPLLLALAAKGMPTGWLPGPCLVSCSSEGAPRGAVVVTAEPN